MLAEQLDSGLSAHEVRDGVGKALSRAAEGIARRRRELLDTPEDVECLHRYRVSVRVARSLTRFCSDYQKRGQNRPCPLR